MTDLPEVKLKSLVNFPVTAVGRTGIDATKDAGSIYLDLNYADFQVTATVSEEDMPNSYNLIWNEETETFAKVPFALQATAGVSSLGGETGAIDLGATLQMTGSTLDVAPFDYVSSIDGKDGAITLDSSLQTISNELAVGTVDLSGGVSTVIYEQDETSAVSVPLIRRLNNTLFASEFGALGDGSTDDYEAIQAFLDAVSSTGKVGHFDSGKVYFVSGGTPTLTINSSDEAINYRLVGYGATIRTDPAEAIAGLYIKRGTFLTHGDEQRGVTVEGLTIQQNNNANATYGIHVDHPNVNCVRCTIYAGDDGVTHHQAAYAGIYYTQSDLQDEATGAFWGRVESCYIKGVGNTTSGIPICILIRGDCNRMMIKNNILGQGTYGVLFVNSATSPSNAANAAIANGCTISGNDFGSLQIGVGVSTSLPALSAIAGARIFDNTFETMVQSVLDLTPVTQSHVFPNILGPNFYYSSGALITNPNSVAFVVIDEYMASGTLATGTVAATATATLGTIAIPGATSAYAVEVTAAGNLQGCIPSGYISSTGVATIRLSNPTAGGISNGSIKFCVKAMATN